MIALNFHRDHLRERRTDFRRRPRLSSPRAKCQVGLKLSCDRGMRNQTCHNPESGCEKRHAAYVPDRDPQGWRARVHIDRDDRGCGTPRICRGHDRDLDNTKRPVMLTSVHCILWRIAVSDGEARSDTVSLSCPYDRCCVAPKRTIRRGSMSHRRCACRRPREVLSFSFSSSLPSAACRGQLL